MKKNNPDFPSLFTKDDLYLFNEGRHYCLYEKMGSHPLTVNGVAGTHFAVWAPDAVEVSVIGDFNGWSRTSHPLRCLGNSGIWENFVPGVFEGSRYKYHIISRHAGRQADKADPVAFRSEQPPGTASVIWNLDYSWCDSSWLEKRPIRNSLEKPMAIYELHLGSWKRNHEGGDQQLNYHDLAPLLSEYILKMGFTHVEFLPLTEHPYYASWGYQAIGYYSPTSRYGSPQDLMYLIDQLHQNDIGVILDWVPSHFASDAHGLSLFDGSHLYEHADPRRGFHPDWHSPIFNYGRTEVSNFLINSALFWLDKYHVDCLRVDAVASMLYLDYSRKEGKWLPNQYGGRENLEAVALLRRLNEEIYCRHPGVQTIAEESTAWPNVSRPTDSGGLGFGLKWDLGWMNDTLKYLSRNPVYRRYHQSNLTFRQIYAFSENFVLPLSHDEVVHGKGSLLSKMPGDDWQKFANLRLLFGYMYTLPGKKLLFMGGEFGQWTEWNHDNSLDWYLQEYERHAGIQKWVQDLNFLYREEPVLHELDCHPAGFAWVDCADVEQGVISFLRRGSSTNKAILAVLNFTPVPHRNYRVGVPSGASWTKLLNSDSKEYGGSGYSNQSSVVAEPTPTHQQPFSLNIDLPPLAVILFEEERNEISKY